jgi:hypothetical protein
VKAKTCQLVKDAKHSAHPETRTTKLIDALLLSGYVCLIEGMAIFDIIKVHIQHNGSVEKSGGTHDDYHSANIWDDPIL